MHDHGQLRSRIPCVIGPRHEHEIARDLLAALPPRASIAANPHAQCEGIYSVFVLRAHDDFAGARLRLRAAAETILRRRRADGVEHVELFRLGRHE